MITKKRIIIGALLVLGFSLIILYNGRVTVSVANEALTKGAGKNQTLFNRLTGGTFGNTSQGESIDSANALFLEGRPKDPDKGKALVRYINEANAAIPLTTEALQFALMEFTLGERDLLEDAIKQLEEGKMALQKIEPPTDALVFHKMSIQFLPEWEKGSEKDRNCIKDCWSLKCYPKQLLSWDK